MRSDDRGATLTPSPNCLRCQVVEQPQTSSWDPILAEKAAALGFSLVCNHPFVDGNKRVGHAAMETFLVLNGWEFVANVDEQEQVILQLAAGNLNREEFTTWVQSHLHQRSAEPGATAARFRRHDSCLFRRPRSVRSRGTGRATKALPMDYCTKPLKRSP